MINELLTEINKAEKEAATLTENALAEAKTMCLNADAEAGAMKTKARADAKAEKTAVIAKAEAEAEENYTKTLEIGAKEAEKLKQSIDITNACNFVADSFLKKWAL